MDYKEETLKTYYFNNDSTPDNNSGTTWNKKFAFGKIILGIKLIVYYI